MKSPKLRVLLLSATALLASCGPGKGSAQVQMPAATRSVPTSALGMKQSFAPVVKKAAPAVVNISAKRVVRQQADPFWQMFGMGAPSESVEGSLGSGVIVRSDGIIITNNHVIQDGQEITVSLSDRREFPAKVLLADSRLDLAVLKIDAANLPTLALDDSGDAQVGDLVLAIGDPFGVGQTVTNGIVSALNRTDPASGSGVSYIQTDAAINPGNSGGALVDMDGDLLGVNSFILSQSGTSSGVGFAIPAALVRRVVETAAGGAKSLVQPWLGADLAPVTSDMAQALGLAAPHGVIVNKVAPGSAAASAGLRSNDIVTAVGGQAIDDENGVGYALNTAKIGGSVAFTVSRAGRAQTINVPVQAAPDTPARNEITLGARTPLAGMKVANLNPAVANALGVDPFSDPGVVVETLDDGDNVLQPGDFIRAVNGMSVSTTAQLQSLLGQAANSRIVLTVERNGQKGQVRVQ